MESTLELPGIAAEAPKAWSSWQNPVLTPEEWCEMRRAVEAGLPMMAAAKRWDVDYEAVKKRAQREEWLTDSRIKMLAAQVTQKEASKVTEARQSLEVPMGQKGQNLAITASQALSDELSGYKRRSVLGLAKTLEKAIGGENGLNLKSESIADVVQVGNLLLKLHQVGQSDGVQVSILFDSGGGEVAEDGGAIEIEGETIE